MTKLFIIGNGFDLAHGLPTTYAHFKAYLRSSYSYNYEEVPELSETSSAIHNAVENGFSASKECAQIIDYIISEACDKENWSDFEKALGCLPYQMIEEEIETQYDKDGDTNLFNTRNNYEDAYSDFTSVLKNNIPNLFSDWVKKIVVPLEIFAISNLDTYFKFSEMISDEDIFLTTNYTDTLEKIYGINRKNVTHIHGDVSSPIVGHGNNKYEKGRVYHVDEYINSAKFSLRKPTKKIVKQYKAFFENLSTIDTIYSYGFSFGEVDLPYIKEIVQNIDTSKITWFLHSFTSPEDCTKYIANIQKCGFLGKFGIFE
jgi:hypothetical protein